MTPSTPDSRRASHSFVKRRQGRLEIKQRTDAPLATRWTDGVEGYVEAWRKWGFQLPNGAEPETGWVVVHKARQILKTPFPDSEDGSCCTLELGTVTLSDGTSVKGFVAEPRALDGARDITSLGGWRAYIAELG